MSTRRKNVVSIGFFLAITAACVRNQPQVIVVTPPDSPVETPIYDFAATFVPSATVEQVPKSTSITTSEEAIPEISEYVVQAGDTLSGIAALHGVSLELLLTLNDLPNPDVLSVGQILRLPEPPSIITNQFRIIPDNRFVYGPGGAKFNIVDFVNRQTGYIRVATDQVNEIVLQAAQIIERVSLEYSIDPRLLLALLEFRAKWLTDPEPNETLVTYPMERQVSPDGFNRGGLYRQLAWAANQLNRGYYGWKHRGWKILEFADGSRVTYNQELNAGTIGIQYFLSFSNDYSIWQHQVEKGGFYSTYYTYFGDPFEGAVDPLVPISITQPDLSLPFASGETWFYTGGPHGGWGSGSAWAAVDFAPPDERSDESPPCYISDYWATAVASGLVVRSDNGTVILDLDMDGDETTGWTVLYLHIASEERIAAGTVVQAGDRIGHPSCEGGFSNGTHMHIARRYNGEWIPAACKQCGSEQTFPSMVLGDWKVVGITGQEYQGYLDNGIERRTAEQGRLTPVNRITW